MKRTTIKTMLIVTMTNIMTLQTKIIMAMLIKLVR